MIGIGKMLKKARSCLSRLGGYFCEPDCRLNRLDLTEKWPDAIKRMMPPVLQQANGFRAYLPVCRICPFPPLIDMNTQFIDDRCRVILLGLRCELMNGKEILLRAFSFTLTRLRNRGDESGGTTAFNDLFGWLPFIIKFPMSQWIFVRRVEDGLGKKSVFHLISPRKRLMHRTGMLVCYWPVFCYLDFYVLSSQPKVQFSAPLLQYSNQLRTIRKDIRSTP